MPSDSQSSLELWEVVEKNPLYKDMESTIRKILEEQWNDVLFSGVVNTMFKNYKNYFVNRRGKRITVRKAEEDPEVRSIYDLKQQEKETQQNDRFIVGNDVLNMKAFLAFLALEIALSFKSAGLYYSFKKEMRNYLKKIMVIGGQDVVDEFIGVDKVVFRLSNSYYKKKIAERVMELVKGMDDTSKKRLINALVEGIKLGETKTELIKRVQAVGKDLAKSRAKMIVKTETQSALEYMRYETARLNGCKVKRWRTAKDENVCGICQELEGKVIGIENNFNSFPNGEDKAGFLGRNPPAHPNCNCSAEYAIEQNYCASYVSATAKSLDSKLDILKAAVYKPNKEAVTSSCINPNAIWAGGNSLVGKDKEVGNYYEELKAMTGADRKAKLAEYSGLLTSEGYVQLRLKLGLSVSNL